ncbi:DEAD/DEAH box helicase family protein [Nostoc cf. edaphicum LEGE 07299]|uniref:DEAD/DEAH box helicase family protein n=1 Tax=Nostoc cf. edaphicum LEGE 07299 TaxID=2777974 RepID=A0ABR9U203_9NOSO|nr:type I restriction endonuclease subunit R [Nostoc edaphicum]MBE9106690.1 DEAD/DEAH box helicase family protein [Nostoc cf. edaphicum LEGE 07299]
MSDFSKETDARINIDDLLRQAGWNPADKSQVMTEISAQMADGRRGRADYLLLDQRGRPLAVIEAKKRAIEPYVAKNQALPYARKLEAPFIFLSNGELIYFWDYQNDDARIVNSFFSRRDLERLLEMRSTRQPLATIEIPEYYTRQGEIRLVRPYQRETMQAIDHAVELGKRRFLLELPTGTGKTDLICLQLKRLIQSGYAEKILFLVDREQLAKQALEAIQDVLQRNSYWLKPSVIRQEQQITVCLLQTMISRYREFTSGYFDVVVADECHRSIYGVWQTALTHFDAFHIGLTATPAAYIERNTFDFYNCRNEQPDFNYSIQTAFEQKYLVPYRFATGITEIIAEGAEVDEVYYDPAAFERKWTNEASNRLMMQEFDRLAWENYQELAPGQKIGPGKSIVFALTKNHAARLTRYLNELHPECKGRYAEVITSDVANADDLIRQFKYEDSPQVAVSVDMLNTGFDCREVLHLVMCRTVRSPILYQQIRGRGTRTAPHIDKRKFVIYDFFRNHEYFNDSDTDIYADTGRGHVSTRSNQQQSRPRSELIELGLRDRWQQYVSYVEVGTEGERVDKRDYLTNWEQTIQSAVTNDPILQKIRDGELLTETEETELVRRLNTPRYYFNEENLRRAYRNYNNSLIDFIRAALGTLKIKSHEELLEENFRAWLVSHSFAPAQAQYLSLLKNRGIAKGQLTIDDLFLPPLSVLNAAGLGIELFGEQGLRDIFDELNRSVFAVDATGTEG